MPTLSSDLIETTENCKKASDYFQHYRRGIQKALSTVNPDQVDFAFDLLLKTVSRAGTVFVAGNGGSAAISDHLGCDWMKGASTTQFPVKVQSLVSNVALLTAYSNDHSFESALSHQLEILGSANDLVVMISSSGNSPNIIELAKKAKQMNITSIALTGFQGGELNTLASAPIHVHYNDYGVVEDCHQSLMHTLAHFLMKELGANRAFSERITSTLYARDRLSNLAD